MGMVLEWRAARAARSAPDEAVAAGAEAAARLLTELEIAKARFDKSFAVLRHLVEHPARLVSKDELLNAVWPGVHVSEQVLKVQVAEIRKALGDMHREPQFIETAHRRGYRFIATTSEPESAEIPLTRYTRSGEGGARPRDAQAPRRAGRRAGRQYAGGIRQAAARGSREVGGSGEGFRRHR